MCENGRTPLHRAAEKGHGDAVKALLQSGAYLYSLDMKGKTPLHLAAQNNHSHIVKILVEEEARSYKNQHNFLHMAALKDESSLAKMLLKAGASIDGKDEKGQPPLSHAVSHGSENTAKVLLEAGASVDSNITETAFNTVQKNLPGIVAALIDRGTDIDALNHMRYTPLLLACETGKAEAAEVLITKGANFGMRTPASDTALNQAHETPLHIAALHNKGALVGLLVNAGAQINAATKEFVTPLHIASQKGSTDAAQQLLYHKAHVNPQLLWAPCASASAPSQGKKLFLIPNLNLPSVRLKPFPLSCHYRPLSKAPLQISL
uniref:Uncharacterized protein n=1 Tax=Melopsittacus undulatus TaxID=13146 RepID=A0A8V5G6Q3_MELUD